jgi:cyanate permease
MNTKAAKKKNLSRLASWTVAWTLSTALATFGSLFLWEGNTVLTALSIVLNLGVGIGMVLANRQFIEDSDELEKKVQLEAMALTLGLTLIVGIAYSIMDSTNLIPWDAEISFLVMFMGLFYLIALVFNRKRYL